jgi:PAS domain S-box-containing protein
MPRPTLRTKLLGGVLLLLLPVLGLLLWEVHASFERQREAALDLQVRTAAAVAATVEMMFANTIDVGRALANDPIVRSFDPSRLDAHLRRIARLYPQYFALAVFDRSGNNVGDSQAYAPGEQRAHLDADTLRHLTTTGEPEVYPVFQGIRQDGKPMVAVNIPILVESEVVGDVGVILDPAHLSTRLANMRPEPRDTITVIDPNGRIAFDSARPNLSWEERDLSSNPIAQAGLTGGVARMSGVRLFGDDRVAGLVRSAAYGWLVLVTAPEAEVLAPVHLALRRDLLAFALIAIVALLGTWGFAGVVHGMAERLKTAVAAAALAREKAEDDRARFQMMFDCAGHAIMFLDSGGAHAIANPEAERMFGRPPVSPSGEIQYVPLIFGRDGRPLDAADLPSRRALRGEVVAKAEFAIGQPDGSKLPVLASAAPVLNGDGDMLGAIVIFQDITPMKELERLREEWVSVISHDLRQPLSVIVGNADILRRLLEQSTSPDAAKVSSRLQHIQRAASNQDKMINDLLDMSRLEANRLQIRRELVDAGKLVHDVVERIGGAMQGHPVRTEMRDDLPAVECDPARLEQVLSNLVSNAAKYSYPRSEIRVELTRLDDAIQISVVNRGDGISPEDVPRLFERFHRTASARERGIPGIGLGLYVTKGLVEAHGGRIWVESSPGETTAFRFTLPAAGRLPSRIPLEVEGSPSLD